MKENGEAPNLFDLLKQCGQLQLYDPILNCETVVRLSPDGSGEYQILGKGQSGEPWWFPINEKDVLRNIEELSRRGEYSPFVPD